MLYSFLLGLEIVFAAILIVLILLHRGRGSEAGAIFTGSSTASASGTRSSTSFLTKIIAGLSVVFLLSSLSLAYIANRDFVGGSVVSQEEEELKFEEPLDALEDREDSPQTTDLPDDLPPDVLEDNEDLPRLPDTPDDLPDNLSPELLDELLEDLPREIPPVEEGVR